MAPRHLAPVVVLLALSLPACDRASISMTAPGTFVPAALTAEPASLRPEFLPSPSCLLRPAFRVRLTVIVGGGGAVFLSGLRFHFLDRLGSRALPLVSAAPGSSFTSSLPSSSPVPIPGVAPLASFSRSGTLPFIATFGCDVVPDGTLIVIGDLDDGRTAEMRLRVGS